MENPLMLYRILFILLFIFTFPQRSNAQVTDTLNLGEVVVTASKSQTTERETTKPVTVITREEIERNPSASLSQLLNQYSGIQINGALSSPGKDKSVYLRGASTKYTVILIDGFPVTDPSSEGGAFDLRLLPLDNVERIEIVKGSMSTLYGSDAIAGVINVITRTPNEEAFNVQAKGSIGSFETNELSFGVNGKTSVAGYNVTLSRSFTKGITEAKPQGPNSFNPDGYERLTTTAQVQINPLKNFHITPFFNYSAYEGDYDNGAFTDGNNRYKAFLLNSGARIKAQFHKLELRQAITWTESDREFTDDFGVFHPKARVLNSDTYAWFNASENARFLLGLNAQRLGFQLNDTNERILLTSPYVTAFLTSGIGLNAELGLRLTNHEEYGTNWSFNLAPVYNLNDELKILASVSSGFKAPTLNELFGPFGANTDLKPEESISIDAGINYRKNQLGWSASLMVFHRKIDNLIAYDGNLGYLNVHEQNDYGLELTTGYNTKGFGIEVFYNYLDGAITQNGEERDNLIRRPDHSLGAKADLQLSSKFQINLDASYIGERKDQFFNMQSFQTEPVILDPYMLINAGAQYTFMNGKVSCFATVNNLTNADYTEVYGFNTPGIHFMSGLKVSL